MTSLHGAVSTTMGAIRPSEASTIFIPVFLKGGLVWTGDSHCRQGNGEVNLTALERELHAIGVDAVVGMAIYKGLLPGFVTSGK